jgi:hypothetical protein
MYFLPESPRWLVAKDRHEEALQVLAKLHAGGDTNDLYVKAELGEIVAKIDFEKRHKAPSYFSLLFGDEWRRMWIGIGVVSSLTPRTKFLNTKLWLNHFESNSGNKSQVSTCKLLSWLL